jgi:hypothetical protein
MVFCPSSFAPDKLLPVNGAVQMTTFLAIIFGTVLRRCGFGFDSGVTLDRERHRCWNCNRRNGVFMFSFPKTVGRRTSVEDPPREPGNTRRRRLVW